MSASTDPEIDDSVTLAEACEMWQSGQNAGSSPIRAGARVITGIPHYFSAPFISDYDEQARTQPRTLAAARVLLDAIRDAPQRTADEWCAEVSLPARDFAGRGLKAKSEADDQIDQALSTGRITMPLWGVSLDREVAAHYGGETPRWIFELVGRFPAVAAWIHSGGIEHEQELICGGVYTVVGRTVQGATGHVRLEFEAAATT
jgi:hypothetical protein